MSQNGCPCQQLLLDLPPELQRAVYCWGQDDTATRECFVPIRTPCDCQVEIINCRERLCVGDELTLQAEADEPNGTFQWQVIQSANQVTPISGQGPIFTLRAQNPSRASNDVVIRVTYTLPDGRSCKAERYTDWASRWIRMLHGTG